MDHLDCSVPVQTDFLTTINKIEEVHIKVDNNDGELHVIKLKKYVV